MRGICTLHQEMTLEEYQKVLEEKRKVLLSLKGEERKVDVDKEFQSMQLVFPFLCSFWLKWRGGRKQPPAAMCITPLGHRIQLEFLVPQFQSLSLIISYVIIIVFVCPCTSCFAIAHVYFLFRVLTRTRERRLQKEKKGPRRYMVDVLLK